MRERLRTLDPRLLWVLLALIAGFGVAPTRAPGEWQEKQSRGVPLKTALTWHDSQSCSRCAPVSS